MATKRTYINSDEELIIQGKLTIEGNITQKEYINTLTYTQNDFQGDRLVVNSDGVDPNGDPTTAILVLKSGSATGEISYSSDTDTIVFNTGIEIPELTVTGNIALPSRNFSISGDGTAPAVVFDFTDDVDLVLTLNNSGVTAGTYASSANQKASITVNSKGIVTAASTQTISITSSQVSNFNTAIDAHLTGSTGITYSSGAISITNTGVTAASYGSASIVPTFTVNAQGQLTVAANATISINSSQVSNFTTAVRGNISVTDAGGDGSLTYSSATGVITYTGPNQAEANARIDARLSGGTGITYTSGVIATTITQYTDALARAAISVTDNGGDGSLSYSNTSGIISYTGPSQAEANARIDARVSGGDGITYSSGVVAVNSTVVRTSGNQSIAGTKTFTGSVVLPATTTGVTQANADNSTNVATTAYVTAAIDNLIAGAPGTLDTLNELAAAINDDANVGVIITSNTNRISTLEGRTLTAGSGLTGGGTLAADRTFNVGAGAGITVNADNVALTSGVISTGAKTYGSASQVPVITVDTYGRVTGIANTSITIAASQVTGFNTAIDAYVTGGTGISYATGTISTNDSEIVHDNLSGFVANEHIDHSTVSITAGSGLTGGGNIVATRTLNVGAGDGISVTADAVAVDSTVVRTTGDQSIAGVKQFTGEVIVPHNPSTTANGSIYRNDVDAYIIINNSPVKITPASDVGEVEDVGATGTDIYAGARYVALGNANIAYHGIRSIDGGTYTSVSESANVITVDANIAAIRGAISASDTGGDGSFSYNSTSGVFTYTGPSATEVRAHFSAGSGITLVNGVISATGDNYNSWTVQTDSGAGAAEAVSSGETLTIQGGTNITVTNTGNVITIRNDNLADIESVTAGSGLTGGGNSGNLTLNVGAGTGITVNADNIALASGVVTAAAQSGGISAITVDTYGRVTSVTANAGYTTNTGTVTSVSGGAGLTGTVTTTGSLAVGAGDGITVNADDVAVNVAYVRSQFSAAGDLSYNASTGVFSFTNDAGDIESVTAGSGLTGGGTSGAVTLNIGAGAGITVNADNIALTSGIVTAGTYGTASQVPAVTVDTYGRVTGVSNTNISIAASQVTGLATSATTDTTNATNISSGTLASARLPDLTVADFSAAAIQTSAEAYADSDTVIMTAAAVDDRITSYGYSTTTGTVTSVAVAGGNGLTSSGGPITTSGTITLAVGAGTGITVNADNIALASGVVTAAAQSGGISAITVDTYGRVTSVTANAGYTTNTGTVTSVTGGNGLSGSITTSGALDVDLTDTTIFTSTNTASRAVVRDASGNFAANVITATATAARYADLAENYQADAEYTPGTVLVFGGEAEVTKCVNYESTRVAGVVTTNPAHVMNSGLTGPNVACIALRGRVPVLVKGVARKGDVLVTAGEGYHGHAVASMDPRDVPAASIVGKAIEDKLYPEPGLVEALI